MPRAYQSTAITNTTGGSTRVKAVPLAWRRRKPRRCRASGDTAASLRRSAGALRGWATLPGRRGDRGTGVRDFPDATTLGVRRSSAGMGTPELERALEMVEPTTRTHLHHVAGQFVVLTAELVEFLQGCHTAAVSRKPPPKDVRDVNQLALLADGARLLRGRSEVLSGPQQFWVRVTYVEPGQPAAFELCNEMPTGQPEIDRSRSTGRPANRVRAKLHERRVGGTAESSGPPPTKGVMMPGECEFMVYAFEEPFAGRSVDPVVAVQGHPTSPTPQAGL